MTRKRKYLQVFESYYEVGRYLFIGIANHGFSVASRQLYYHGDIKAFKVIPCKRTPHILRL